MIAPRYADERVVTDDQLQAVLERVKLPAERATTNNVVHALRLWGAGADFHDPALPTGSDRIHAAISALDPERTHDAVVNVQGDMPMLDPAAIRVALATLGETDADIATLAAVITDPAFLADSSVNKVAAGFADPARPARALYFSKAPVPWGDGPHYEHVGLYARAIPQAVVRRLNGRDHQLNNDMSEVAAEIRRLGPVPGAYTETDPSQ